MAKKGKGDKPTSARGHREENVIRFREKKELIRVDRYGNPLNRSIPFNVMSNDWLASHKHNAPPTDHTNTPPPDNVTSITSGKPKVSKPVSQSGNEAEKIPHRNHRLRAPHGWLHDKHLAAAEFKNWSRITKEIGRGKSEMWTADKQGKLHSDSLDLQRKRSIEGHNKLKFEKPPSTVHNPLLTKPESGGYSPSKPLDRKFWDMSSKHVPMAPSGIPISEFVTGKFKPKENAVVYTTDTPPWEEQPKYTPPPTPTRDWRVTERDGSAFSGASNDQHYHAAPVEKTATEWARQTKAAVQWFINHVEVQNWPTHILNFARWVEDGPIVNTGAINEAAKHSETELVLMRSLNEGLQKDWHMLDQALLDSQSENNLLRQELQARRAESDMMELELAHRNGDTESFNQILKEMNVVEPKTPRIPDDVDSMLREFRMYQSFERVYGPEHAFARFVYDKPELGQVMREHADMNTAHRQELYEERDAIRRIGSNMRQVRENSGYIKYPEIKRFRECAALYRIKNKVRNVDDSRYAMWWKLSSVGKSSLYYSRLKYRRMSRDVTMIHHWGTKATPFNRKKPVNYQQVINKVVGVRHVPPYKYMNSRMAKFYLNQTWKGKAVKAVNKVIEFFNTEVNPIERSRMSEEAEKRRMNKALSNLRKKERKAKAVKLKADGNEAIRQAEQKLSSRGFVIVGK